MAELEGLLRASRYSLIPNGLGYCGPKKAEPVLKDFISNPSEGKAPNVQSLLEQFYGFHPYLELIARENSLETFDGEVVEAYWLGNPLLENVPHSALQQMILDEFSKPSLLPKRIVQQKADSLPKGMLPHHSMHVLHINFITPKLEPVLKNLSSCLVLPAEVKEPRGGYAVARTARLIHESARFKLLEETRKLDCSNLEGAEKGDLLSVHWNRAVELIDKKQYKNLMEYTSRNLSALNPNP